MFYDVLLRIEHHEPVESSIYLHAIRDVEDRVRIAYREFLESLLSESNDIDRQIFEIALEVFDGDRDDWLWIETTEPGSGNAKGKGRNRLIAAIMAALGYFSTDVVSDSKPYRDVKDYAVHTIDYGYDYLKQRLHDRTAYFDIACSREGNRLIVTLRVHPAIENKYKVVDARSRQDTEDNPDRRA